MAQVSWMWGGKRYYGTLIRETKTHKFARTKNGKIKKIKKQFDNTMPSMWWRPSATQWHEVYKQRM